MLFYILLFGSPILFVLIVGLSCFLESRSNYSEVGLVFFVSTFFSLLFITILLLEPFSVWSKQSNDLGTIKAQQELVKVYEKEVDQLNARLSEFEYPKGALMNNDTPVASIVQSLSHWQEMLAEAIQLKQRRRKA